MKRIIISGLLATAGLFLYGQPIDSIINATEVKRIETILSADDMRGRKIFTPGIEKAAAFIADEFRSAGLISTSESDDFRQKFTITKSGLAMATATLNGTILDQKNVKAYASQSELKIDQKSGYKIVRITSANSFSETARNYLKATRNLIVLVDPGYAKFFSEMNAETEIFDRSDFCKVFLLTNENPVTYSIEIKPAAEPPNLCNIIGVLPGRSKKDEYVIFSGHYDHVGIGIPFNTDSIYNGANDNASGVTAVIMLAKYFKALDNNERTLLFVAFTGEEYGFLGSGYFAKQLDPKKVKCMFNIEMIGTQSKWGKNSAYITGYEKSGFGTILRRNLKGTGFDFLPDPYKTQQLYNRSDNIILAKLGIAAHTIMTADVDADANYHRPSDEIGTLDIDNMTRIITGIALSSTTIVAGKESP